MKPQSIVIVEDEPKIAQIIIDYLHSFGYQTVYFPQAAGVVEHLQQAPVSAVLLDIMLPDQDGISLCQAIRRFSSVPIMFLTARVEEVDRILGLEIGADDYLCKPFSPRELVARLKALLRRTQALMETQEHLPPQAAWQLDEGRLSFCYQALALELSSVEFAIMRTLAQSPGQIFSRSQLIDRIYNDHRIVSDRTIDSHIKKLRHKLRAVFGEMDWIQSVYGVGYRFVEPESEPESSFSIA
ncbi:MAG: response regulator [Thiotrichales bacterium]|nr:response regulator [Thiotrichales bacterium]